MHDLFEFPAQSKQAAAENRLVVVREQATSSTRSLTENDISKAKASGLKGLENFNAPLGSFMSHITKPTLIGKYMALDPLVREVFQERAAILEYDAGFSRDEAERRALRMVMDRIRAQSIDKK